MTITERNALLNESIAWDPSNPTSRRFTVRRGQAGLELFDIKFHDYVDGEPEFHGHPASFVPASILRAFSQSGQISRAEYRHLVRTFGCP
jgi:hypothetical protein